MENTAKVKDEPMDDAGEESEASEEPERMDFEQVSVKEEHEGCEPICEPICELKEDVALLPKPPPITIHTSGIQQRFLLTPVILAPPPIPDFTYLSPKVKKMILPKTFVPVTCINTASNQSFPNNFNIRSVVDKASVTIINQIRTSTNIYVRAPITHNRQMKKGWLSDADKEKIPNMHAQGISNGQIARQLGCTKTTVARWLKRWETEGHVSARTMPGRPRITTPQQDALIIEELKKDKNVTSKEIQDKLKFFASKHTIIRRLRESKEVSKFEPNRKNVKAIRLAFAHEFIDRPMEFWMKIIFCDQYVFSYSQGEKVTVHRPHRKCHYSTTSPEKFSVTVWGWTTCEGFGKLWEIDGRLTSSQNLAIIRDVMIPSFNSRFPDGDFYIIHDKSPFYTSKKARGWAQDTGLCVVNWPPKSSDMNLIGRLCSSVKVMLNKSRDPPRSRDELSHKVHHAWRQLMTKPGCVSSLAQDIPCRLSAIIQDSQKRKKSVKSVKLV